MTIKKCLLLTALVVLAAQACKKDPADIPVEKVELNHTTLELTLDNEAELKATVTPANATNGTVTWNSDQPTIVSVTDGKIKALASGSAKITATAGDKSASCTITVIDDRIYLPVKMSMVAGDEAQIISLEYDAQNRLTKATSDDRLLEYTYPDDKFYVIKKTYSDDNRMYTETATRDENTMTVAEKNDNSDFVYTEIYTLSNEQLVSRHSARDERFSYDYTYDNAGNLTTIVHVDGEWTETSTLTYDDKKGLFSNVETPAWLLWDATGLYAQANNIVQVVWEDNDEYDDEGEFIKFEYTYNQAGYPITIAVNNDEGDEETTINIEYIIINK